MRLPGKAAEIVESFPASKELGQIISYGILEKNTEG